MLEHNQITRAIAFIRPNAGFAVNDSQIVLWESEETQPTMEEIEAGWVAYQAAQEAEAEAKATQKAALLDRLGLTEDEAKLLLS